jgi:lipopolysaccharide export system permease protein
VIIARYLTREVVYALLGVTIILLLALLSQQVVRYLNFVAVGKIPTNVLLQLVSFEVPYILSFLLPLGLYLGVLLVYSRMYIDNEMSILQMYGFGSRRLMRLTMMIAFVVALIVLVLMIWVNPIVSVKRQQVMASDEATVHLVQTLMPGRFQVSPDGRHVLYVEKLSRDHQRAENVFLAQEKKNSDAANNDAQHSWMLVLAREGYQVKDKNSEDQFFVTEDGYRYEGTPGQNDYKIIQYKKYAIRIPENEVRVRNEENEELPMWQLWQDYSKPRKAAEFQWRISLAITTFLLAILAVPLSAVRPRQGRYLSLIPAVLVYIVYIQLLYIARHWVESGAVPISIGMWWVHGVMFLFILSVLILSSKQRVKK